MIRIRSDNSGWARRTLSEVEEQVERAWLRYTPSVFGMMGIALFLLFLLSSQLDLARARGEDLARTMWLQRSDLARFEPYVRDQRIITDHELRELVTTQLRNILEAERPPASRPDGKEILILIPVVGIVACMIILIATCYPKTVFLWGDEVERYHALLQRRKILWGLIIGILFVGLLSTFLSEGLIAWLRGD